MEPSNSDTFGPALPPHLQKNLDSDAYGPSLPPTLTSSYSEEAHNTDDEDETYGPLPPGVSSTSTAHQALEERALEIKLGILNPSENKTKSRDEWMTELPAVRSGSLGLGSKHFRKNNRPDFSDRSSWTDSPQDKANKLSGKSEEKVDLKKIAELKEIKKRDKEQKKMSEKYKRKNDRSTSLLEIHRKKLKSEKRKEEEEGGGKVVRKPFNRETDLKVNAFDDAQKKSILKKAMHLDDRFSKGQSKYL